MPTIPFGPWHPDLGVYATGASEARNCIRAMNGYRPLASLADFNAGAIAGLPTLLTTARANDGTMYVFSGDDTKLYRLNAATMAWDDVSRATGYATLAERWRGVQWGNELVFTQINDIMQVADLGAGTPYADLDPTNAPNARFITAAGPYLVVGYTSDIIDGLMPNRLRWCAIENIHDWLPSAETTADWQDVPDVGHLKGLTGGRQLNCIFEDGIVVGTLIGAPKAFRFDRVEGSQGCIEANSVVQFRGSTFYLARSGFSRFDGRVSAPIGMRKVNRWFFNDAIFDKLKLMSAMIDRQQKIIAWLYCGSGSDGITPNHMMIYNYDEDEFTWSDINGTTVQLLGGFTTPGYNIDNVDGLVPGGAVDLMPAPFDDPFYAGGVPIAGAFVDKRLHSLAGNPMKAIIDTPYIRLIPNRRSTIAEVRDIIEGQGAVTCTPYTTDDARTEKVWPTAQRNAFGFFPVHAEGAFHKMRFEIGAQWSLAQAADVVARLKGER